MDKVKQAIFNILGADVENSSWWDLFGGTGAVGIEALSRGAAFVRFSDLNRLPVQIIKENLQLTGFTERAEIRRGNVFPMLAGPPDRGFDFIYVAPPQFQEMWPKVLSTLDSNPEWMNADCWVLVQIHPREEHPLELHSLVRFDQRRYGSTLLLFYQRG
jgi:16S rRNA (guanine(966)-N(2))-methyltransferase RsmD